MTSPAMEIKLIQIGRSQLGLDDDTYRAMLARLAGGKTSSKDLTAPERHRVLQHLKASGFEVKPRAGSVRTREAGWQHEPKARKLRALWYALADVQAVQAPADAAACWAAVEGWAKRQMSTWPDAPATLRFATGAQLNKLIEELKAWARRVGARAQ